MSEPNLKYPNWQVPYRAALIETNPELLTQKIASAEQAVKLRFKELFKELENSADRRAERIALTDALTALKILGESYSF